MTDSALRKWLDSIAATPAGEETLSLSNASKRDLNAITENLADLGELAKKIAISIERLSSLPPSADGFETALVELEVDVATAQLLWASLTGLLREKFGWGLDALKLAPDDSELDEPSAGSGSVEE